MLALQGKHELDVPVMNLPFDPYVRERF